MRSWFRRRNTKDKHTLHLHESYFLPGDTILTYPRFNRRPSTIKTLKTLFYFFFSIKGWGKHRLMHLLTYLPTIIARVSAQFFASLGAVSYLHLLSNLSSNFVYIPYSENQHYQKNPILEESYDWRISPIIEKAPRKHVFHIEIS